ncbi:MAG: 2-oxoacid:acceptor oxidoreductase family protein [candidate division Zixibacteria bacterium]|nr:2-oxoacid:acceptor oxidoreductase family protein [candidate division Zixibacteria bacterium]
MKVNDISLLIGGYAGQGVQTIANSFARLCTRAGLYAFVNFEYPSNIKGEHNYAQIMVSEKNIGSSTTQVDLLVALDIKTANEHISKIRPGGALIYDNKNLEVSHIDTGLKVNSIERDDIIVIDVPFSDIVIEMDGSKKMINSIGLGAVIGLLRLDFELLDGMLHQSLSKFEDKIIKQNLEGARYAYDKIKDEYSEQFGVSLEPLDAPDRMFLTGKQGFISSSTPSGSIEMPFSPAALAIASGAGFVAAGYSGDTMQLDDLIVEKIKHRCFSLINIMQVCVSFNPEKSYKWYKERVYKLENENCESTDRNKALNLALSIGNDRLPTGILYQHKQAAYEDSLPQIKKSPLVNHDIGNVNINSLMADFV